MASSTNEQTDTDDKALIVPEEAEGPLAILSREPSPEELRPLTDMQAAFVHYYLITPNATKSAELAGYSRKSATNIGAALLKCPNVAYQVGLATAMRCERLKINPDWVLVKLKQEAERVDYNASHNARVQALGLIGKHLGMFQENVNVNRKTTMVKITKNVSVASPKPKAKAKGKP